MRLFLLVTDLLAAGPEGEEDPCPASCTHQGAGETQAAQSEIQSSQHAADWTDIVNSSCSGGAASDAAAHAGRRLL